MHLPSGDLAMEAADARSAWPTISFMNSTPLELRRSSMDCLETVPPDSERIPASMAMVRIEQSPVATETRRDLTKETGEMALALRLSQPVFLAMESMREGLAKVEELWICTQSGMRNSVRSSDYLIIISLLSMSYTVSASP